MAEKQRAEEKKAAQVFLKEAAYAFDCFKYHKCLEKIKKYEKKAFPSPINIPVRDKLTILAYKAHANKALKRYDVAIEYFEEMIHLITCQEHLLEGL